MNLNISQWKDFKISDLFDVSAGKYHYPDEYDTGNTNYLSAASTNNGISQKIDLAPEFDGNCIITGKIGCTTFYQKDKFCATSDVNVLRAKFDLNDKIGLFITTVINKSENYKWCYGRQCRVGNTKNIIIKLPARIDKNKNFIVDKTLGYNPDGYVPDFKFMEEYIKSLHHKPITTKTKPSNNNLNVSGWKEFYLHKLFNASMGNGIDAVVTTSYNPKYNYVSRNSNDNGVVAFVDEIDGIEPFPAGVMTLSLGGSFLGSCFIQDKPFYTAQNVGILEEKNPISNYTKLFIATLIRNECKIKYLAFGRELNAHFRKDFTIKLPIKRNGKEAVIDKAKEFSDEGYVPDWEWMEEYMKLLPYSDRIL